MRRRLLMALTISVLVVSQSGLSSAQGEATRYILVPSGAATIGAKDYFSISLAQGWVSTRHSALQRLLSNATKSSVLIESNIKFFDGQKIENAVTFSNTDVKQNVGKSWGINPVLFQQVPGDAELSLDIQLGVYKEDVLSRILGSLDDSKAALPADLLASPAIGYSKAVSGVFRSVFGTDKTKYPFIWQGSLRAASSAITGSGMKEHFIVLIAPQDADDASYKVLDAKNLSYDEASQRLRYNNSIVTDWSYAVLVVRKADPYDIVLLMNQSNAPWALLGVNVFRTIPTSDAKSADELKTLAKGLVASLGSMTDLLKRELRFSAYTRGLAVSTLAARARDQIQSRCTSLSIGAVDCPTDDLTQVVDNTLGDLKVSASEKASIKSESQKLKGLVFK